MTTDHANQIASGERFEFGANWQRFLASVDDDRVREAERSLAGMLGSDDLRGKRFLDIGCGSGLFSLAAHRMGASVHSFDFDPASVACTLEIRRRWSAGGPPWVVEEGSALDADYLLALGQFDIVYSWGVLHHTGDMWTALDNSSIPVSSGGQLFIAIYNDQGRWSRAWWHVKKWYCSGHLGRAAVLTIFMPLFAVQAALAGLLRNRNPLWRFRNYRSNRGMSIFHDWIDWLGGFPFEYASVAAIKEHFEAAGYTIERVTSTSRWGCNEFVFRKPPAGNGSAGATPQRGKRP